VPFNEEDDLLLGAPTKGRWSYACSKAIDEFLAIAYWREKKLPVTIVRLFNTVGPRQTGRYGMVIPSLVKQAIMGQPLTVFGDGEQSRCFGHVRDVVGALVALIQTPDSTGEIFNVGSDREITINSLAELVREMTESSAPIVHMSYDEAYADGFEDMRRRVPDLTKIRRLIGWAPRYEIRDILGDVIEHMRNGTGGLRS
jgi:UDP-glucose 4-epimerase